MGRFPLISEDFQRRSDDIVDRILKEAEGSAVASYRYFPEDDSIEVCAGPASKPEFATIVTSAISSAPKVRVFHHIHYRERDVSHDRYAGFVEAGAARYVEAFRTVFREDLATIERFEGRLRGVEGSQHWAWDGEYGDHFVRGDNANDTTHSKRVAAMRCGDSGPYEDYMSDQGCFQRNFCVATNFSDEDKDLDQTRDGRFRTRFCYSFENERESHVRYSWSESSLAAHEFGHLLPAYLGEDIKRALFRLPTPSLGRCWPGLNREKLNSAVDDPNSLKLPVDEAARYSTDRDRDLYSVRVARPMERIRLKALHAKRAGESYEFRRLRDEFIAHLVDVVSVHLVPIVGPPERRIPGDFFDRTQEASAVDEKSPATPSFLAAVRALLFGDRYSA